jgi:hypothetical protein
VLVRSLLVRGIRRMICRVLACMSKNVKGYNALEVEVMR